jgi:hypothetical protein
MVRLVILLLLLACVACFGAYAVTGKPQYRTAGIRILKWTVAAGLIFFGVLIFERLIDPPR